MDRNDRTANHSSSALLSPCGGASQTLDPWPRRTMSPCDGAAMHDEENDETDLSRRQHLRQWARLALAAAGAATVLAPLEALAGTGRTSTRTLVAYYSRTGHTRQAALVIARAVGADIFEIEPAAPYPRSYQETVDLNHRQQRANQFPPAGRLIPNLASYGAVFLGYPIWAVDLPRFLYTFFRRQNFAGKTLAPFSTSAMSGLAGTEATLRRICLGARLVPGLALPGGGRGHNTLVTSINAESKRRSESWSRASLTKMQR
jgi:flavodoxin